MMSFAWYLERWRSGLSAWNGMDGVWGLGRRAGEAAQNLKLSNAGKAIVDLALLIWPSNLKDG
jgi:hypothetical protein